jgi:phosphomannomutase/phosphoglucomutase
MIEAGDLDRGAGSETTADVATPYVDEVAAQFHFPRRIRVVVDAGNGTGGPVTHRVLERLNAEAVEMFFEMDGRFPNHHPDPTVPRNLEPLIARVLETKADLGIAFDGDTDRIGAVDERGSILYGDQLMILYAREILARTPGSTFIGEVKCSQLMYDDIAARGGHPIMWKTGHSLIKAKMKETHAALAGEMSGHMFFADRYHGYDDAIYAACRLMEIVSNSGRPLSTYLADLPRTVTTPEIRFDCPDEIKFEVVRLAAAELRARYKTLDVDGGPVRRWLGPGARLQHATCPGDALRSHHPRTARPIPERSGVGCRTRQAPGAASAPEMRHPFTWRRLSSLLSRESSRLFFRADFFSEAAIQGIKWSFLPRLRRSTPKSRRSSVNMVSMPSRLARCNSDASASCIPNPLYLARIAAIPERSASPRGTSSKGAPWKEDRSRPTADGYARNSQAASVITGQQVRSGPRMRWSCATHA